MLTSICLLFNNPLQSRFDDYYVFELSNESAFSSFKIMRPMKEGMVPTTTNGYDQFTDVRGDSGTKITIHLNNAAIAAGLLNQDSTLKPLLTKFLESSPYSMVLEDCCVNESERRHIIAASQTEIDEIETNHESEEDYELDVTADVTDFANEKRQEEQRTSAKERSKFIPLRLSMGERKMLRLVEASMSCCEYTTDVDKPFKSSTRRAHCQMKKINSILRGMDGLIL